MMPPTAPVSCDLVVLGGGVAGLTAALVAADAGAEVTLLTKGPVRTTASYLAQGGIAAAIGVIEEVLARDPPRFRVRWDDGRTSIFAPSAGVARIERSKQKRVKA